MDEPIDPSPGKVLQPHHVNDEAAVFVTMRFLCPFIHIVACHKPLDLNFPFSRLVCLPTNLESPIYPTICL